MTRRAVGSRLSAFGRNGDLGASIALIFPVLLAYEIGVVFVGRVAGADAITRALYAAAGSQGAYLVMHACVAIAFLLWIRASRRTDTLRLAVVGPVALEAALYALTLAVIVGTIAMGAGSTIVSALGAAVHEELAFRLALLGGLVAILVRARADRRAAVAIAIALSALAFAAAHHLGADGEPLAARVFAARTIAGVAFALIAWFRSLAHAVYAHALYDLLVLALHA